MTVELSHIRLNGFATHLPLLVACVSHTTGPVLELGCGAYSTPVLHALCSQGRELVSYEYDLEWFAHFKRFNRGSHKLEHAPDWDKVVIEKPWDVAFVDHAPGIRRIIEIKRLKPFAKLIIAHDTEHRSYGYEPVLATFKHRVEWRPYSPWCSVVSDVDDLSWLKDVARD